MGHEKLHETHNSQYYYISLQLSMIKYYCLILTGRLVKPTGSAALRFWWVFPTSSAKDTTPVQPKPQSFTFQMAHTIVLTL